MRKALLVIDMQRDFLQVNGRLPIESTQVPALVAQVNKAIEAAKGQGWPIAVIANEFHPWDPANLFRRCAGIRGSEGARLDERVRQSEFEPFLKGRGDAFSNPRLAAWLRDQQVDEVCLCGVYANGCVKATAKGALHEGFKATVLTDAVGAGSKQAVSRGLTACQRDGASISTVEEYL